MASQKIVPFFIGMNDRDPAATLDAGWLRVAYNIIAKSGRPNSPVKTRPGIDRENATAIADSPCQGLFGYRDGASEALLYAAATNKLYHSDDYTTALTLDKVWTWQANDLLQMCMARIANKDRLYIVTGSDDNQLATTIATLATQVSFTLTAGSAVDDAYRDYEAVLIDADDGTVTDRVRVASYTGATKTVTLAEAPIFTIAVGDTVQLQIVGNMVYDGTDVHPSGCPAPVAAPTVAEAGVGVLDGEYNMVYLYYDPVLDRRSNPSDVVNFTVALKEVTYTLVAPLDDTYTHAEIYRTEAGGTEYEYAGEHAFAGADVTFDDNVADSALTTQIGDSGTNIYDQGPRCKCIWPLSDGRIAIANDVAHGKKKWIYISWDSDHPEEFPDAFRKEAGSENGFEIVCGVPFGENSAVICEDGIWLLNDICTECDLRVPAVGGVGRWCADTSPHGVFFVGQEGVYLFTGYKARLLSSPIDGTWDTIEKSMLPKCSLVYDPELDHVLVAVCTTTSGTVNDTVLALDCRTLDREEPRWAVYPDVKAEILTNIRAATAGDAKTFGAFTGGVLGLLNEATKNDLAGSGTKSGTATSATATTLADTAATFLTTGSGLKAAPVDIVAGTGTGQRRWVSSNTATVLTVPTWTTTPDATSEYQIGAIPIDMITGELDMDEPERKKFVRRVTVFTEQP